MVQCTHYYTVDTVHVEDRQLHCHAGMYRQEDVEV